MVGDQYCAGITTHNKEDDSIAGDAVIEPESVTNDGDELEDG